MEQGIKFAVVFAGLFLGSELYDYAVYDDRKPKLTK